MSRRYKSTFFMTEFVVPLSSALHIAVDLSPAVLHIGLQRVLEYSSLSLSGSKLPFQVTVSAVN